MFLQQGASMLSFLLITSHVLCAVTNNVLLVLLSLCFLFFRQLFYLTIMTPRFFSLNVSSFKHSGEGSSLLYSFSHLILKLHPQTLCFHSVTKRGKVKRRKLWAPLHVFDLGTIWILVSLFFINVARFFVWLA